MRGAGAWIDHFNSMPLRTKNYGKISSKKAASVSKDIADQASTFAMHNPEGVPSGIFCVNFKKKMTELFEDQPFGARVNK